MECLNFKHLPFKHLSSIILTSQLIPLTYSFLSLSASLHSPHSLNSTSMLLDCVLAFAHLVFPALTSLHVHAESYWEDGEDVQLPIPHVARNAHGSQDSMPLQSILLDGEQTCVEMVTWTAPDAELGVRNRITLHHAADSARVHFFAIGHWNYGTDPVI